MDIRKLDASDFLLVKNMDTGMEDDYVLRVFPRLTEGNNHLFGLFIDGELAVICGFTIFKKKYAMLGRLRSDKRFRGKNLATTLNEFVIKEALRMDGVKWVGANTEEDNTPARRLLERLGLKEQAMLHGAVTNDLKEMFKNKPAWKEVTNLSEKQNYVNEVLIKNQFIFPYECYYPFPASEELFSGELDSWNFFENQDKTRFFILKTDRKKHMYCHVIYPWDDLHKQEGLWETVQMNFEKIKEELEEEAFVWIDLTKAEVENLPSNHPFKIPAAWVLYSVKEDFSSRS
ncbi:GNAT family N-acetyltransferase [Oceanobacillus sp. CAU 1775]